MPAIEQLQCSNQNHQERPPEENEPAGEEEVGQILPLLPLTERKRARTSGPFLFNKQVLIIYFGGIEMFPENEAVNNTKTYIEMLSRKIELIKFVREQTGCDLVTAKDAVDWTISGAISLPKITHMTYLRILGIMLTVAKNLVSGEYHFELGSLYSSKLVPLSELAKHDLYVKNLAECPNIQIVQRKHIDFYALI